MCLVYIRCLFCEASGTSSIGCFVCDLHRFSIKLNGSVKHWKTWYAYFKYTTRMGYVPPPRRLRYRTNLFVIVGLVQRIDDVSWSLCPVRVEISKYYCLQPFLWNNVNDSLQIILLHNAPHEAMMRAKYAANSFFYLNAMWTLVTSCLEPLNSATDGPAEHLKISEWSSCCVIDSGRMLFVPRLRGDGCHLNHDRWYEIVVRASGVWPFVGSSSFLVCGGRGSIAAVSDEVLQWECMQLQSLWELQRNLWETTEKFMGAGFLE